MHAFAASFFSSSLLDLVPSAQILSLQSHSYGFFFDVQKSGSFDGSFLRSLEEHASQRLTEESLPRLLTMTPLNAAALLRHQKQIELSRSLQEHPETFLTLIQRERGQVMPCSQEPTSTKLLYKIVLQEEIEGGVRLHTTNASNRQELKTASKVLLEALERRWQKRAMQLDLLQQFGVWNARGCILRALFWRWLRRQYAHFEIPELYQTAPTIKEALPPRFFSCNDQVTRVNSDLLECLSGQDRGVCRSEGPLEQRLETLLQFICKTIKMLGIKHKVLLSCRRSYFPLVAKAIDRAGVSWQREKLSQTPALFEVQWQLEDALGRSWLGAWLRGNESGGSKTLELCWSLCHSLERMVALLLEKGADPLLFSLQPHAVVFLPVHADQKVVAVALQELLGRYGISSMIDSRGDLATRVQRAHKLQIPTLAFIGPQEAAKGEVTAIIMNEDAVTMHQEALIKVIVDKVSS